MLAEHQCTKVTHLKQAIKAIEDTRSFNIVLADISVAGGGGQDLFQYLDYNNNPLRHQIIFITGGSTNPYIQEFLETTKQPVLYKPFQLETLHQEIHQLLDNISRKEP